MKGIYFSPTVGKSTGDRARLFDSERFKRKFVTTLAGLRSRRAGWASASSDGSTIRTS